MGIATAIMLPLSLRKGSIGKFRSIPQVRRYLVVLSGLFLGLHFATWISSLSYTSVAVSTVIVDSSPLFVMLLSYPLLDEKLSWYNGFGILLILLGTVSIVYNELNMDIPLKGSFLSLLGSITLACYLVIGRKVRDGMDTLSYVSFVYLFSFIFLLIAILVGQLELIRYELREYVIFALLAIGPSCIGHTSYNYSLRHFKAAQVSAAIICEPIGAIIMALGILGEVPTAFVILGAVLIIIVLFLVMDFKIRVAK